MTDVSKTNELIEKLALAAEDAAGGPPSAEQVDALIDYSDALREALERSQRGGATLGEIIKQQCEDIVKITRSEDLILPDGDGDYETVWERAFKMRADLDALEAATREHDSAGDIRRAVRMWSERFIPGDRWDTEDARDLDAALQCVVEANPDRSRARVPVQGEPNDDRENLITERTYGHGSITLTHYRSSGRIGVVQRGENSVMDVTDMLVFLQDSGLDEDFSRAFVPDAATEAKQPDGWSTEDRQEAKREAERRWSRPAMRYAEQRYQAGNINGFMLGAEWQKARETFISYKAIADKARAERAAALAVIGRVQETLSLHNPNGRLVKEVLAALDGAPEPEVKP